MTISLIENLRKAWAELGQYPARTRQFRTRRLSADLQLNLYAALRAIDDAPCLLLPAVVPASSLFEVGGMRLGTALGEEGPLLVLSLEDPARSDLFLTVCSDAVQAADAASHDEGLARFLERLDAWRRFLRERRAGLSRNEVTGLIGELVVLQQILSRDIRLQTSWVSPDDGLHDFEHLGHVLEIKTSLGVATSVRISTLDQLDDSGLRRLDLLHVRLAETPSGQSLEQLVSSIEAELLDETSRRAFSNALLRRGLMPDDLAARAAPIVELRGITAYRVQTGFPRLIRSAVPVAVTEADYALELRAIAEHACDADSVLTEFVGVSPHG